MTNRRIGNRLRFSNISFCITFLIIGSIGCVSEETPDRLIGTWMTTSPSHRGRLIEISKEHIIFSSDEIHSTFYTIRGVESRELAGKFSYTIEYQGVGGGSRTLSLRFSGGNPVSIELENQDGIWIRKDEITSKKKEST